MALPVRRAYKGAPVSTTLSSSINSSATTVNVSSVTGWPTTFPFFAVIDPGTAKEEKVRVTAISTLALTVVRAQDDTSASSHDSAAAIYPVFTATEADEANQVASAMTTKGDLITTDGTTINRLAVGGTNTHVLQVDSSQTNGIKWGQVATAGIADGAVTSAKIADATIASTDIATAALKLLCPVGTIAAYGGASAPTGWLLCDGSAISGSYTELIALVGANAPDMRGRFPIGDNASLTLLGTGGSTTIAEANLPSHTHGMQNHTHSIDHDHAASGSHSHTISITDPGHRHVYLRPTEGSHLVVNASDASLSFMDSYNTANSDSATTGITATASSSNVDLGNFTGTSGAPSNNTTTATGSGTAYYQPYLAVNYIIKHDY
jgi:microcystin-dependent protein